MLKILNFKTFQVIMNLILNILNLTNENIIIVLLCKILNIFNIVYQTNKNLFVLFSFKQFEIIIQREKGNEKILIYRNYIHFKKNILFYQRGSISLPVIRVCSLF